MPEEQTIVEETPTKVQEGVKTESPPTEIDVEAIKQAAAREVAALYMGALSEKSRELDSSKRELETLRNTPRVVEEEIDGAQFLNAPKKHIADIVAKELQSQLAPIQELWGQFSKSKQIDDIKKQFSGNPYYGGILSTYGDVVDTLIGNGPISTQSIQAAILMVPGLVQSGQLPARGTQNQKGEILPPNITPSSPTPPKKQGEGKKLEMSESEKEIAKKLRMSDEEFVRYRDADSNVEGWKK
jgi:hypothetical protein